MTQVDDGALADDQCVLDNGRQPRLLDIIEIDITRLRWAPHQPENWIVGTQPWRMVGRYPWPALVPLLCRSMHSGPDVFGCNDDRIPYREILRRPMRRSLVLVAPDSVQWYIRRSFNGNRQVRAKFSLGGKSHNLAVTDRDWEDRFEDLPVGCMLDAQDVELARDDRVIFTVGLGQPFNGCCYKLVVGVLVVSQTRWAELCG